MKFIYINFLSFLAFVLSTASCGRVSDRHSLRDAESKSALEQNKLDATRSFNSGYQEFECLLGRLSWLGNLYVELHVTGLFDENRNLGRVRIARLPGGSFRYEVVQQSKIDPSSSNMLSLELVHEDNAAYYESFVTVSNKKFSGPTDDFTVQGASPENFYEASYVWRDLYQNESKGVGACYLAPAI